MVGGGNEHESLVNDSITICLQIHKIIVGRAIHCTFLYHLGSLV